MGELESFKSVSTSIIWSCPASCIQLASGYNCFLGLWNRYLKSHFYNHPEKVTHCDFVKLEGPKVALVITMIMPPCRLLVHHLFKVYDTPEGCPMNKGVINIAMKGLFLFSNMSLTKNFIFYSFFVNYVDTANLDCALKVFMCMGGSQE